MTFHNRIHELAHLHEEYRKSGAKLVVIYGKRRIGKSRLIEEFIKDKEHIYYLAARETELLQIREFKNTISSILNDQFLSTQEFKDWPSLFSYLENVWPQDRKMILAIDEVTYIIKANPSFTSYLQRFWDRFLKNTQTVLILSGSLVGMMIKDVLSHDSPLYGRRTSQIHLKPFTFSDTTKFLTSYSIEDKIILYSLVGGVAKYLEIVQGDVKTLLEKSVLAREGFFYQEGQFLLSSEFRDPSTYMDILKAVAQGGAKINDLTTFTGLNSKTLSSYLDILISLGLVKKLIPPTKNPKKFRGALYKINDHFLNFWHRYVQPNRSFLEIHNIDPVLKKVESELPMYVGKSFEKICEEYCRKTQPFAFEKIGNWWGHARKQGKRVEIEIDIVAINNQSKHILFGECKWQDNVSATSLLTTLKEKAAFVDWNKESRQEHYILFARSFQEESIEGATLVDLGKIEEELIRI